MIVCGTTQSAAASYNWAVDILRGEPEGSSADGNSGEKNIYDEIESLARSSSIGANGLFFLPYLMGERTPHWDPHTRGAFVGFTLYHNRADMIRAVYGNRLCVENGTGCLY